MRNLTRFTCLLALGALLIAGCGEEGSSPAEPEELVGDLDPGTARVTIGTTTWTATAIACANFGGSALGFVGQADSDPAVSVTLDAIPADPPSNSARVDVSANVSWRAGEAHVGLGATIPTVTAQNGYGTGSATFVNTLDPNGLAAGTYETAAGTYEFNCR